MTWQKFKEANTQLCINLWDSGFCSGGEEVEEAFRRHPFAWMWVLLPICGVIGFYEVGDSVRWENRVKRLEEQREPDSNICQKCVEEAGFVE